MACQTVVCISVIIARECPALRFVAGGTLQTVMLVGCGVAFQTINCVDDTMIEVSILPIIGDMAG
jgi:hypothetical protein